MIDIAGLPQPPNAPPPRSCVRVERPERGLALLVLDPPHRSLAVFDLPLLRDLDLALDELERDAALTGLVITGRTPLEFAAGADIDAIGALTDPALVTRVIALGQTLFERVARLRARTVAAIGGAAPGGAYELALACGCIVAADARETRIGLPETQLGILPAWGGCQRLPRRVGVAAALGAILSGKLHSAREAKRAGLVDRLTAPEDLLGVASDIALGRARWPRRERGAAAWLVDKNPLATAFIARAARKQVLARTRGRYPAPLAAIPIVARAPRTSLAQGFVDEQRAGSELAVGPVCKNLIAIFRMSEEAKKLRLLPDGTPAERIARAGVLGAGVMGRDIASLCAERGVATRLFDIAPAALDDALLAHRAGVEEKRKRRRLADHEARAALDRLDTARALAGFAQAEIVVEAVAEKLEIKRSVFTQIAAQVASDALLATNTSSLSVGALARELPHPERVVGLHFFNPVKKMPLVEIVRAERTSPEAVARCAALVLALGKTPVVVADVAGFLVNRLLGPYLDESLRMFAGGVEPARIDRALVEFGMPMGPLALLDEVGFDIAAHAAASLHAAYGERMQPSDALDGMLRDKRLGKKSGSGFYLHAGGRKHKPVLAVDLARFVTRKEQPPPLDDARIAERAVLAMLAEGVRALEERVVASARELDLATVFGMGFPPFRGGLLRYADSVGARALCTRLDALAAEPDIAARPGGRARFAAPPLLRELAAAGRAFHA